MKNNKKDEDFKTLLHEFINRDEHEYKTLQQKICYFIVERIYNRVKQGHGNKFGAIKVDLSQKLIIDGNHRYIAYKIAEFDFKTISYCKNFSDAPPYKAIRDITIDDVEDWDLNNPKTAKFCNDDFLETYNEN